MSSLKTRLGCGFALAGAAVVLVLFVLAVARTVKTQGGATASASASASARPGPEAPGSRALLDGLRPGDSIAGWPILRTRTEKGALVIDLGRRHEGFSILIRHKGADKRRAPEQTDRYDLYFSSPWTSGKPVPQSEETKVLGDVAVRLRRTEKRVPVPPGL